MATIFILKQFCWGCDLRFGALTAGWIFFLWSVNIFLSFAFFFATGEDDHYVNFLCRGTLKVNTTKCIVVPEIGPQKLPKSLMVLTYKDLDLYNKGFKLLLEKSMAQSMGCMVFSLIELAGVQRRIAMLIIAFEIYALLMIVNDLVLSCVIVNIWNQMGSTTRMYRFSIIYILVTFLWFCIACYLLLVVHSFRVTMIRVDERHPEEEVVEDTGEPDSESKPKKGKEKDKETNDPGEK